MVNPIVFHQDDGTRCDCCGSLGRCKNHDEHYNDKAEFLKRLKENFGHITSTADVRYLLEEFGIQKLCVKNKSLQCDCCGDCNKVV